MAAGQKRKIRWAISLFLVMLYFSGLTAQAQYGGGSGTAHDPYLIYTAEQMNEIGAEPNDWDKHFKLIADIDLSSYAGTDFNIIGNYGTYKIPFTGVFDGSGHTISNFSYTSTDRNYIGLFGYVKGENAVIKDLGLIDANIDAGTGSEVGSLVGHLSRGTITGCYAEGGSVLGNDCVGGLVGENGSYGTITNCYAAGSVSGSGTAWLTGGVGGLVGDNNGTISDCSSAASVSGNEFVGGLVGSNDEGTITNCYATGSVSGGDNVGGLVGINDNVSWGGNRGVTTTSFWDIETSGQLTSAGGQGRTTAQMQMASTFLGWDRCGNEGVWTIDEGNDYPRLWWENKPGEVLDTQQLSDLLTGAGTQDDPYLIYTAEQLNVIGVFPCEWDKHFKLMSDIDLSHVGTEFNIIGISNPFTGVFDGNGKKITNLNHARGLFGYVSGAIKDLGLIDANIDAGTGNYVGSLVGENRGTITGCYVEGGSVLGGWGVGGLVGVNRGTIDNCYSAGSVTGYNRVGGLVGYNYDGTITNCSATGSVTGDYHVGVGGLVGLNRNGTITNCYATGIVTGEGYVGGLVGWNWNGTITNCYAMGSVTGTRDVGGLVGSGIPIWVYNSFWDIQTSGLTTSAGGTGKTTAEMQMASTFIDSGWDFVAESANGTDDIWSICEGTNYPRLAWQIPAGDFVCPDGVNFIDFAFFAEYWGDDNCNEADYYCEGTDLDFSGTVDEADLEILVENWLEGGNDELLVD